MDLLAISSNAANVARGIAGIRYAYAREQETIPGTPAVVVGMATSASVIPGNRQVTNFALPVRLYVERLADQPRDVATAYGYVSTFVTTYAVNQSLNGSVQDAYITAWDTGVYDEIGGALYSVVDFTLNVTVHEAVTQGL